MLISSPNHVISADETERFQRDKIFSLNPILMIELFDVWGIYFTSTFVNTNENKYILMVVDYVSKWMEAIVLPNNEGKTVTASLMKNIFS